MDLGRARYLISPAGREALAAVPAAIRELDVVALATALRKHHAPGKASALAEQVTLASRAAQRFGRPLPFLFTPAGLEMMTHPAVAARRAVRLATLGLPVVDLTCGIGGDLAACVAQGLCSIGIERDRVTAILAAANVPGAAIVQGDATRTPIDIAASAVVLDPSRREGVRRTFDAHAFSPPWDVCLDILRQARAGVMKASPGIDHALVPAGAELEFVQLGRSLREAAIWWGAGATPGLRRAVLLPMGGELCSGDSECPPEPRPIGSYIIDPQSCVTRAGLVRHLASRMGDARLIDREIAYLTSDTCVHDPMAETFEVLTVVPFSAARLKVLLRKMHWRPDEIRRRGFPVEPDELRRLMGTIDGTPVTLLCTTIARKRTVVVGRKVGPAGDTPAETA